MQLAHWIGTTWFGSLPGWLGTWFSVFPNVETVAAQGGALAIVIGSYLLAEHIRVRRPRRRGTAAAVRPQEPPERPAGVAA